MHHSDRGSQYATIRRVPARSYIEHYESVIRPQDKKKAAAKAASSVRRPAKKKSPSGE